MEPSEEPTDILCPVCDAPMTRRTIMRIDVPKHYQQEGLEKYIVISLVCPECDYEQKERNAHEKAKA